MDLEQRVDSLEKDMRDIKVSLAEIKTELPHLATREMVSQATNKIMGVIFALTIALIANFVAPYLHDHENTKTTSQLQQE